MILNRVAQISLAFVVSLNLALPAVSADAASGSDAGAGSGGDSTSGSASSAGAGQSLQDKKLYEGHLQTEVTNLETSLKEVSTTMKHLKRGAWDMFVEVQRQNMVCVGEPDVIGPIVIPAIPSPSGLVALGGYLPPRKKWLDYLNQQIDYLSKLVQTDINALTLPPDASDTAKTEWQALKDTLSQLPTDVSNLASVTQGPKYDNMEIAKAAQIIEDHVARMEKSCKKVYDETKKEVKQVQKDMKDLDNQIKQQGKSK